MTTTREHMTLLNTVKKFETVKDVADIDLILIASWCYDVYSIKHSPEFFELYYSLMNIEFSGIVGGRVVIRRSNDDPRERWIYQVTVCDIILFYFNADTREVSDYKKQFWYSVVFDDFGRDFLKLSK